MLCKSRACKAERASVYGGGGPCCPARNETQYTLCLRMAAGRVRSDGHRTGRHVSGAGRPHQCREKAEAEALEHPNGSARPPSGDPAAAVLSGQTWLAAKDAKRCFMKAFSRRGTGGNSKPRKPLWLLPTEATRVGGDSHPLGSRAAPRALSEGGDQAQRVQELRCVFRGSVR